MDNLWKTSAIVLGIASVFALGYALNDLSGGLNELPKHWWSAAPLLGLALAGAAAMIGRARAKR